MGATYASLAADNHDHGLEALSVEHALLGAALGLLLLFLLLDLGGLALHLTGASERSVDFTLHER